MGCPGVCCPKEKPTTTETYICTTPCVRGCVTLFETETVGCGVAVSSSSSSVPSLTPVPSVTPIPNVTSIPSVTPIPSATSSSSVTA